VRQDELMVFTYLNHILDTTPLLVSRRLFQYPCSTGVAHDVAWISFTGIFSSGKCNAHLLDF